MRSRTDPAGGDLRVLFLQRKSKTRTDSEGRCPEKSAMEPLKANVETEDADQGDVSEDFRGDPPLGSFSMTETVERAEPRPGREPNEIERRGVERRHPQDVIMNRSRQGCPQLVLASIDGCV